MRGARSDPDRGVAREERGAVIIVVAVMIVLLIGAASLVFDLGHLYTVRGELQNTTDSAALAGTVELDGSEEGLDQARVRAREYASRHRADFRASDIADDDIVFGRWNAATRTFVSFGPKPEPSETASVNAVRVRDRRAGEHAVTLRLARAFGGTRANVGAGATAVSGGPDNECGFPMVVADCALEEALEDGACEKCFRYQDGGNEAGNAAWTTFRTGGGRGVPDVTEALEHGCFEGGSPEIDPDTGECVGPCVRAHSGTEVDVHRGNMMSTGASNFCPLIRDILRRDGEPRPFTVRVPVLESGGGACDIPSRGAISGFATIEILGARCGRSEVGVLVEGAPSGCQPPPSEKWVVGRLRCDLDSDQPGGGAHYGTGTRRVRLVE